MAPGWPPLGGQEHLVITTMHTLFELPVLISITVLCLRKYNYDLYYDT